MDPDPSPARHELLELDPDRTAVPRSRAFVADTLSRWGLPDLVDDVSLCTSELVSNVVVHAGTPIELRLRHLGAGVRLEVRDSSTFSVVAPPAHGPSRRDPPGRRLPPRGGLGLLVVSRLAADWGVDPTPDGKVVWAAFEPENRPKRPAAERAAAERARPPVLRPATILSPDDWPEVEVRDVPVRLLVALEAHMRTLVREAAVIVHDRRRGHAGTRTGTGNRPDRTAVEVVVATLDRYWDALRAAWAEARPVGAPGPGRSSFVTKLPPTVATDGPRFLQALDACDDLARRQQLLSLPADDELVAFRRWFVASIVRQVAGSPAESCPFAP